MYSLLALTLLAMMTSPTMTDDTSDYDDHFLFERRLAAEYDDFDDAGLQRLLTGVDAVGVRGHGSDRCGEAELASNSSCLTGQCLTAGQLLTAHRLHHTGLSSEEIRRMSASVLYQSTSGLCAGRHHGEDDGDHAQDAKPPRSKAWGYGFLSVTIINSASVMGFFFKPCMNSKAYKRIMMYMVSLAVGTLSGSALMFLIPESFEFADSEEYADVYAWKLACVCGGIYMFFLTERLLTMLMQNMDKKRNEKTILPIECPPASLNLHTETRQDHRITPFECPDTVVVNSKEKEAMTVEPSSHGHSHGESIKTVAWMIIIGDAIHNFMDGLSLGAAFSNSIMGGVSVSVAVFCEELPHELGDFAVLLNSGMTVKQAVLFNFSSACTCYLGFICGVIIGEMTSGSSWVFVITAGMFLYISLVDMLPEVNAAAEEEIEKGANQWSVFLVQNLGLLTGWGAMLLLSKIGHIFDFK